MRLAVKRQTQKSEFSRLMPQKSRSGKLNATLSEFRLDVSWPYRKVSGKDVSLLKNDVG